MISSVVVTYNEEKNIKDCLESLKWCDEIVVVDSYSKDKTIETAKKYTKNVYYYKFQDDFSKLRNFAISKTKCKWVLVLDADERLPSNAGKIIREVTTHSSVDGCWIPRKSYINRNFFFRYGIFYPDYQLRLFRNCSCYKYEHAVHERIKIPQKYTAKLAQFDIIHNHSHTKYDSYSSFKKFIPYIKIEGKNFAKSSFSNFQLIKNGMVNIFKYFYLSFIRGMGFRDGYPGFRAAVLFALYRGMIYFYALVLRKKESRILL